MENEFKIPAHVYLDTEVYISNNFDYSNSHFQNYMNLFKMNKLFYILQK